MIPTFFVCAAEGQNGIVCFVFVVIFVYPFVFVLIFLSEGLYALPLFAYHIILQMTCNASLHQVLDLEGDAVVQILLFNNEEDDKQYGLNHHIF